MCTPEIGPIVGPRLIISLLKSWKNSFFYSYTPEVLKVSGCRSVLLLIQLVRQKADVGTKSQDSSLVGLMSVGWEEECIYHREKEGWLGVIRFQSGIICDLILGDNWHETARWILVSEGDSIPFRPPLTIFGYIFKGYNWMRKKAFWYALGNGDLVSVGRPH